MHIKFARLSYGQIFAASSFILISWVFGWITALYLIGRRYLDVTAPYQPVLSFNLIFGFFAISAVLLALWFLHITLPLYGSIMTYMVWSISAILIALITYHDHNAVLEQLILTLSLLVAIFGITISFLLGHSIKGIRWIDRLIIGWRWIGAILIQILVVALAGPNSVLSTTPLGMMIIAGLGSAGMFLAIRDVQTRALETSMIEMEGNAVPLNELMTSTAQNASFEVIHDSGKAKPKGKPKPWTGIPHLRLYAGALGGALVMAIVLTTTLVPVREVRVPGFVTPNATNSTPGPQWGNRLPPRSPQWERFSMAMITSPAGDIPANIQVRIDERYYDFGADMWWYRLTSYNGQRGDAWEWQLSALQATPTSSFYQSFGVTPINGPVPIGSGTDYQIYSRAYDGQHWLITLQAQDGSLQTVDANVLGTAQVGVPLPEVAYMNEVGTGRNTLITREQIGSVSAGISVQLLQITWIEGKPPMYLIADTHDNRTITAQASEVQLVYTSPFTPTPAPTATPTLAR